LPPDLIGRLVISFMLWYVGSLMLKFVERLVVWLLRPASNTLKLAGRWADR
jgi:hypothetical protein